MNHSDGPDVADAYLGRLRGLIAQHGWAVQGVGGAPGQPSFAYTVGLSCFGSPELIVLGVPFPAAGGVLNDLGGRIRDGGRPRHGDVMDDLIPPYRAVLIDVADPGEHLLMAQALARAGRGKQPSVRALQIVYPDDRHRWPWDSGSRVKDQPILGMVPPGL